MIYLITKDQPECCPGMLVIDMGSLARMQCFWNNLPLSLLSMQLSTPIHLNLNVARY
jgi:hypothetical protein